MGLYLCSYVMLSYIGSMWWLDFCLLSYVGNMRVVSMKFFWVYIGA